MSYVVINALTVPEGQGAELEARFRARKNAVDSEPGFEGFQLLRPVAGETRYFVVTTWQSRAHFEAWRAGNAAQAHAKAATTGAENAEPSQARSAVATDSTLYEFETVDL